MFRLSLLVGNFPRICLGNCANHRIRNVYRNADHYECSWRQLDRGRRVEGTCHSIDTFVREVEDLYGGIVKLLDTGTKVKVDQSHVKTVVPAQGKTVIIVNGAYRGKTATLKDINEKKFCCTVSLDSGPLKGRTLEKIAYEDISKQYQPS